MECQNTEKNIVLEIKGQFVITVEFGSNQELKQSIFNKINEKSQDCDDPQELTDLLNPKLGQNMQNTNNLDLSNFEGGEEWSKFLNQMGEKHGVGDLGKRKGLPLFGEKDTNGNDGFFTSDGEGGLMRFDLEAELAQM